MMIPFLVRHGTLYLMWSVLGSPPFIELSRAPSISELDFGWRPKGWNDSRCGLDRAGLPDAGLGFEVRSGDAHRLGKGISAMKIAELILGILSLVVAIFFGVWPLVRGKAESTTSSKLIVVMMFLCVAQSLTERFAGHSLLPAFLGRGRTSHRRDHFCIVKDGSMQGTGSSPLSLRVRSFLASFRHGIHNVV